MVEQNLLDSDVKPIYQSQSPNLYPYQVPISVYSFARGNPFPISNKNQIETMNTGVVKFNGISFGLPQSESNQKQPNENKKQLYKEGLLGYDWELHKKLNKEGVNPTKIAKIIRNDDIEKLQEISTQNSFDFNQTIPKSIYEKYSFINIWKITLIDYAAFFGSINCFKFLLLNGAVLRETGYYAVAGGNIEIIKLCEQNKAGFECSFQSAIIFHRNDIFYYIYENKLDEFINQGTNYGNHIMNMGRNNFKYGLNQENLTAVCQNSSNYEILLFFGKRRNKITRLHIINALRSGNLYLVKYFHENNKLPIDSLIFTFDIVNIELIKYILEQKEIDVNAKDIYLFYLIFILIIFYFKIIFGNYLNHFKQHLCMRLQMVIQK